MPLKNYTTTVSVDRTVSRIQAQLVKAGARAIHFTYDGGVLTGLAFTVRASYGEQAYSLPANVGRVRALLGAQGVQPRFRTGEHAARVAWAILADWVAAQLAIVETEMVSLDQVLLPYAHTDQAGTTLYEAFVEQRSAAALMPGVAGG
jgi:hypothetical protein